MSELLRLERLCLGYGANIVVPALDLRMATGSLLALLGPSGCGKTTVMRAIAGLLPVRAGRIHLAGKDITGVPANRRDVGLVFQSYALFPHLTVFENLAFGLRLRGTANDEMRGRVAEAIAMVGLTGFEARLPRELSGGQQQRVALARAVVVRPKLLLLDEPLSNLDARLRLEMRSELQRLQRELALPMIYVTHDQSEALALADRVVVLREGRIAQAGTPREIFEAPADAFVARFVGFENHFRILEGRIAPVEPGQTLHAWRPSAVRLGAGPHRGVVRGQSYLGESVEWLIESPAGFVKAQSRPGEFDFRVGATIDFDLPPASGRRLEPAT